jgi:glutathione S-transferase
MAGYAAGDTAMAEKKKPQFFDMIHSNNAARCRIWIRLKGLEDVIQTNMIVYDDLQSPEYLKVNPQKKVPAFITDQGTCLFESFVIMQYLEDKYGHYGTPLMLVDPEERALASLLVRVHDIYISSPNCTQPGYHHTQGALYLSGKMREDRVMDKPTRAAKLKDLWKHLTWLEETIKQPYMAGDRITHADMTWFPTCIFVEFLAPRNFQWPKMFHEKECFPKLTAWFEKCYEMPEFKKTHDEIMGFWKAKDNTDLFDDITEQAKDPEYKWKYP